MQNNTSQISTIMKALGDENRLKILAMLESGSLCACEMLANLQIRQSTLSHHMSILSEAGLVSAWSVGKWTHYRLCPQGLNLAQAFIAQLHATAAAQELEDSAQANLTPSCACATARETEMSIA
jgi:ArsR family transcriptional regulator